MDEEERPINTRARKGHRLVSLLEAGTYTEVNSVRLEVWKGFPSLRG